MKTKNKNYVEMSVSQTHVKKGEIFKSWLGGITEIQHVAGEDLQRGQIVVLDRDDNKVYRYDSNKPKMFDIR